MDQTSSSTVTEFGSGITRTLKDSAASQITRQKDKATEGLHSLADAIRQTGQSLRERQQTTVAHYVERAADQIESVSTTMRDRDLAALARDAQAFARRQPVVFVAAAFAAGVLAARFLKSSSPASAHAPSWHQPRGM